VICSEKRPAATPDRLCDFACIDHAIQRCPRRLQVAAGFRNGDAVDWVVGNGSPPFESNIAQTFAGTARLEPTPRLAVVSTEGEIAMADTVDEMIKTIVASAGGDYHAAMRVALLEMAKLQLELDHLYAVAERGKPSQRGKPARLN
jgi:hypothetical protein